MGKISFIDNFGEISLQLKNVKCFTQTKEKEKQKGTWQAY